MGDCHAPLVLSVPVTDSPVTDSNEADGAVSAWLDINPAH